MKKFWNWTNQAQAATTPAERTLHLNGTIAEESWFDDDVTPQLFADELNAGSGDITVWINSPGGDCVAAAQIYNMLMEYKGNVTVKIDGIAASAASVIAMAGTRVLMSPVSILMIHNPMTVAMGDAAEMEKAIEMLASVKDSIINAYEIKTGLSRAKLSHLMDAETWMDAGKAVELGFADEIMQRTYATIPNQQEDEEDEDDTPGAPEEDDAKKAEASMLFSRKAVNTSLVNKLRHRMVAEAAQTKGKPIGPDVDLDGIAHATVGFTGADLENLLNEAALLAARRDKKAITMEEIDEAALKVQVGSEKKSHRINEKDKKITAYHEAGHAVVSFYLEHEDPVHQISVIPRGMAGGFTLHRPIEDKAHMTRNAMLDRLVTLLGGRVAEALVLGDISTGASNDIERATEIARGMVTKYGMSDKLGPIAFGSDNNEVFLGKNYGQVRNYSESVASEIDAEIESIIRGAYNRTENLLNEHMDKIHIIAQYLFENEKMSGEEFTKIMEETPAEEETAE